MIGKSLGCYAITAKLGEGGMGEVYRATDTKLEREVAIKVLPAAFTEDPERLARFEREAKLLAQLHHPNIASIFGLEDSDGVRALVMELVEGPTLAERLESGALPLNESLSVSLQIAHALEEAHEKGIVHRDLKPQNVKASIEGKVKVLDFGLAKAMDPTAGAASSGSQLAKSPTLTMGATVQGMILGTAAYMAPEQAAGATVDRRADVWSFGVVLYEMLSGRRLFEGETVSHVLAGVLKEEPDFSLLPADTPPRILRLVRRCLRKKPRERLQAIGDARVVIEEVLAGATDEPAVSSAAAVTATAPPARLWPLRASAALLALSTLALGALVLLDRPAPPKVVRATILPPPELAFHLDGWTPGPIALSPDGRQIAFAARAADGRRSLWVRAVDTLDARELPATDDAQYPFWSPDSKQIGFFNGRDLKKIALAGGPPVTLAKAPSGKGGSWSARGVIVFTPDSTSPISVVSASGGEAKPLTALVEASGDSSHRHPRFLPDGEHILFVARRAQDAELRVAALDGSPPVTLLATESNAEYAAGRLLFVRDSTLMAQPFDAGSRTLSGEALPIVERVLTLRSALVAVFTASAEGSLAYQTGSSVADARLVWRDREGKELGTLGEPAAQSHPRLAPDGMSVAVEIDDPENGQPDLWILDVRRGLRSRFTFDPASDSQPVWSPDGQSLAFASLREGTLNGLWVAPVAGTEPPRRIASGARQLFPVSWSPDGERLVANAFGGNAQGDVVVAPATGGEPSPLVVGEFGEDSGTVSPDGRWLAYRSNETGRAEIYVTSFPVPGRKWQVSQGEGHQPSWRSDGRELFYRDVTALYAAEVDGRLPRFEVGAVRRLFALPVRTGPWRQYDVTPDGQRFLVAEPIGAADVSPVTLVLHWDAELPKL